MKSLPWPACPPSAEVFRLPAAWAIGSFWDLVYGLLPLAGQPPLSRFMVAELSTSHFFDISRARSDFGYQPRISLAEGMRRLATSMWAVSTGENGTVEG